jgi:putative hemolysin
MATTSYESGIGRLTQQSSLDIWLTFGRYRARLAETDDDRSAIYSLRFLVFNLELNEGVEAAYETGEDRDAFDAFCDHLLVEDVSTGKIVGTYRMQSGARAAEALGYYSACEFDCAPYEPLRASILELGRACVHREHRSLEVLTLLWRGIARYAKLRGLRYLVGCCSVTTQDARVGATMYRNLSEYLAGPEFLTVPTPECAFPLDEVLEEKPRPPKLLRAYLTVGAKICGPPAIDREFGTIDFLTLLDLEDLSPTVRARFLG